MTLNDIVQALSELRIVFFDCDGVLTSGDKYYSTEGVELLRFNVRDGYGIRRLISQGIDVRVVSRSNSPIIVKRAADLGDVRVYLGVSNKAQLVQQVLLETGLGWEQSAFVGDDVFDLEMKPLVRLFACPDDAVLDVREEANIILSANGGGGAVREFCDLVEQAKIIGRSPWHVQSRDGDYALLRLDSSLCGFSFGTLFAMRIREALAALQLRIEFQGHLREGDEVAELMLGRHGIGGLHVKVRSVEPSVHSCELVMCSSGRCGEPHSKGEHVLRIQELCGLIYEELIKILCGRDLKLELARDRGFVKIAPAQVSVRELEWHQAVMNAGPPPEVVTPMLASAGSRSIIGYTTELISGYSLRDIVTNHRLISVLGNTQIIAAFESFLQAVESDLHSPLSNVRLDAQLVFEFYHNKLATRTQTLKHLFGGHHSDLIKRGVDLGIKVESEALTEEPAKSLTYLRESYNWQDLLCPPRPCLIHGDMHFGNIMFGTRAGDCSARLYLVDGKNQRFPGTAAAVGDPAYDCGKLMQSILGRMDRFLVGLGAEFGSLSLTSSEGWNSCADADHLLVEMSQALERMILRATERLADIHFHNRTRILYSLHTITMPPCLPRLSRDTMAFFYTQGVVDLNRSIQNLPRSVI